MMTQIEYNILLCMDWDYAPRYLVIVENMFYEWKFIHKTEVPIDIKNNIYFISLNTNTVVFSWGDGNSNKSITKRLDSLTLKN